MDLLRSLPHWREHVVQVVANFKKKKGPTPHKTRIRQRLREEKEERRRGIQEAMKVSKLEERYAASEELQDAVYGVMSQQLVKPAICSLVLQQCANEKSLGVARKLHKHMETLAYDRDAFLGNQLIRTYGKCGRIDLAYKTFHRIRRRNTYSWNVLIRVYVEGGHLESAKLMFDHIPKPNSVSWNTMIQAYALLGNMEMAEYMFGWMKKKTSVTWTTMMGIYSAIGRGSRAVMIFKEMDLEGQQVDDDAVAAALDACSCMGNLEEGEMLLGNVVDFHALQGPWVARAVVDLYGRCGRLDKAVGFVARSRERHTMIWGSLVDAFARNGYPEDAREMLMEMPRRDSYCWTGLLRGYASSGQSRKVLDTAVEMDLDGAPPGWLAFPSILDACVREDDLVLALLYHREAAGLGIDRRLVIANSVLDTYQRLESFEDCVSMFEDMPRHDARSWSIIIAAYANHGLGKVAMQTTSALFKQMLNMGVQPDERAFDGLLAACTNNAAVEDGYKIFTCMELDHGVRPDPDNYVNLVSLLGHAGYINTAVRLILEMPFEPNVPMWMTLLSACEMYGDSKRGKEAMARIAELRGL